jgi:hypothetical protein
LEGVKYRLCRGRTAECPKNCGNSGEFAVFRIVKYTSFKKHGKYGDKRKTYHVQVSDYHKQPKGDPAILKTVRGLKDGDHVLLSWRHDYVTRNRSKFPEHPIVKLEKIDTKKAEALLKSGEKD